MPAADTAKMIAELGLVDKLSPGLKKAQGNLGKFESGMGRVGKGIGQVSAGLTRAGLFVGGAVATGLVGAAKAAIDFEDAFTGVEKTIDATPEQFAAIEAALRKMSTTMPTTAIELAAIAEAGGAMGIEAGEIEKFTRQVAILGSTTNVSVEDAATALGQMKNIIGLTADEFDNFSAALVELGNEGNSTEAQILEIERRAGGAAKLAGVAKEATLGWAAAAANLGLNEELAGTALQRFFVQSTLLVSKGGAKLDAFAKTAGMTAREFKKAFAKDASGALESFIGGLSELSKAERLKAIQKFFGKGTGMTRLLADLSESFDKNLTPALDDSVRAWEDATAAEEEFAKKNANVKSAIARLKNGVMDAAVTVGEGFTPALGRAAEKLSEFLQQDANQSQLRAIGEDIGEAIDKINWKEVLDGARQFTDALKIALAFAQRIFGIINALPTEVKGAGLGALALDKLSGGLLSSGAGNIVGGLASALTKSLAASIPIFGKAFVQPVFVTNPGFGAGGGGIPGGAGAAGAGGLAGLGLGAAVAGGGILAAIQLGITQIANSEFVKHGIRSDLKAAGMFDFVGQLHNLGQLVSVGDQLLNRKSDEQIAEARRHAAVALTAQRKGEQTVRTSGQEVVANTRQKLDEAKRVMSDAGLKAQRAGERAAGASTDGASRIVAAIAANRPVINLTTVNRTYNRTTNYGSRSGDRDHAVGGNAGFTHQ